MHLLPVICVSFLPLLHFVSQDIEDLMNIQIYASPIAAAYIIHTKHIHLAYNSILHLCVLTGPSCFYPLKMSFCRIYVSNLTQGIIQIENSRTSN